MDEHFMKYEFEWLMKSAQAQLRKRLLHDLRRAVQPNDDDRPTAGDTASPAVPAADHARCAWRNSVKSESTQGPLRS